MGQKEREMRKRVFMDTGPLVASINRRDRYHSWVKDKLGEIAPPMFTCEPVLAEACFLLQDIPPGSAAVLELVERGVLRVEFQASLHVRSLAALMAKYSNVPMSLADACLVRMTELYEDSVVMTLDGDFLVYRRVGRQAIPVLMPRG
jgi:predicted nucleic acid-binding protein